MAENVVLGDFATLQNSSIIATLNANNTLIETAFADCLSLAGTLPNAMNSNLDMNGFQIFNLPAPSTLNSAVRLIDLEQALSGQSGGAFGILAGNNTWLGTNTFTSTSTFSGTVNLNGTVNIVTGTTGQLFWNNADVLSATTNLKYSTTGDTITNINNFGQYIIGSNNTSNGSCFAITRSITGGSTHGFDDSTIYTVGTGLAYATFSAGCTMTGTNSASHLHALQDVSTVSLSAGTLTEWTGIDMTPNMTSGTVTNRYGVFMSDVSKSGGTITNMYGVYLNGFAAATNNFGFYQVGTSVVNYLNGITVIGVTATPGTSAALTINNTTASTTTTTGSVQTTGGIGVGGSVFLGGNLGIPATASNGTSGVLRVSSINFLHALGTQNVWIGGAGSFSATPGGQNVGIGFGSMGVAAFTGVGDTAIGFGSLNVNTSGSHNTGVGYQTGANITTGSNNTIVGYNSGAGITTGGSNTIIGANVTGLSTSLASVILIADGGGSVKIDYNNTTANTWTTSSAFVVTNATAATSTTTGALRTTGGHAVGGTVWGGGGLALAAPSTQAGTTFTADLVHYCYICTSASAVTVTLPAASSNTGYMYLIKETGAGAVSSATSNVVPLAGGAAGTPITTAAAKWALLQSDGTSWVIIASN